ncbi:HNH endonuclease signature motif containing protein, partial [Cryobacterium sp. PH31-AA6]
ICDTGVRGILFNDTGQALDVGREQRLFTEQQRTAIALRDGGCIWPDCDRPPSWTEAHHLDDWSLNGTTDTADGTCLCHPHHLYCTTRAGKSSGTTPSTG